MVPFFNSISSSPKMISCNNAVMSREYLHSHYCKRHFRLLLQQDPFIMRAKEADVNVASYISGVLDQIPQDKLNLMDSSSSNSGGNSDPWCGPMDFLASSIVGLSNHNYRIKLINRCNASSTVIGLNVRDWVAEWVTRHLYNYLSSRRLMIHVWLMQRKLPVLFFYCS